MTLSELRAQILASIAAEACLEIEDIDPRQPFSEYLNSMSAVRVSGDLEVLIGRRFPTTLLYEKHSIDDLIELLGQMSKSTVPAAIEQGAAFDKRAVLARRIHDRAQLSRLSEPVAVVGMSCRFPGAKDAGGYWTLLRAGVDAISEVPDGRWKLADHYDPEPGRPGKMYTRWGGFLEDVDHFDPQVFRISPRECESMDPQQRLLLQLTWEALEDAGHVPSALSGSRTGVFVGIANEEYSLLQSNDNYGLIDPYSGTGVSFSVAAGRLSYVFGLRGPSVAVDTACSSSLVALHLACQSLRLGESELAIVGGVNLTLTPHATIYFCQVRVMSPRGRCRTFDRDADGYVRGEGCGVLVLKRLSDAVAAQDRILALVKGSAVNHDGHSGGLTVPNGQAQQEVIRAALANAGVGSEAISYVETHGTGTRLGDSIELNALNAVFGAPGRPPLAVASVKTNIGHCEAAAGLAGVIKVILSLRNRVIPPHLHFSALDPEVSLAASNAFVPTTATDWAPEGRRIAGVSSFGISGTNAHVILEEYVGESPGCIAADRAHALHILPLSGASPEALLDSVRAMAQFLRDESHTLDNVCVTAQRHREHHEYRLAAVFPTRGVAVEQLSAFAKGETRPGVVTGRARASRGRRVVFVCPGQGSQWLGMGRTLYAENPRFRSALDACDDALQLVTGHSVVAEVHAEEATSRLAAIDVVQPVLFALQVAYAAALDGLGVVPDVIFGQSMGEVAAACIAGALSLDDAACVIGRRSALMKRLSGTGAMAVVEMSYEEAAALVRSMDRLVAVAVSLSERSTVISGDPAAIAAILRDLERREVFARPIKVDVASHSPMMDVLHDDILSALAQVQPRAPTIAMHSTVTARRVGAGELDASYWSRNLRAPVLIAPVVSALLEEDRDIFIELSPHPVLTQVIAQSAARADKTVAVASCGRRDQPESDVLMEALATAYAGGLSVDWTRVGPARGELVPLPTYPWQRERYWLKSSPAADSGCAPGATAPTNVSFGDHPLLGLHVPSSDQDGVHLWQGELAVSRTPHLADHQVDGTVVLPMAVYVDLVMTAARKSYGLDVESLQDLVLRAAAVVPREGACVYHIVLTRTLHGDRTEAAFEVRTRESNSEGTGDWIVNATGTLSLRPLQVGAAPSIGPVAAVRDSLPESLSGEEHYRALAQRGLVYGPAFRAVQSVWRGDGTALGRLVPAEALPGHADAYSVPPAIVDAALQLVATAARMQGRGAFVPVGAESIAIHGKALDARWALARFALPAGGRGAARAEVSLLTENGDVLLEVKGLRAQSLEILDRDAPLLADSLLRLEWSAIEPVGGRPDRADGRAADTPKTWILLGDSAPFDSIAAELSQGGSRCLRLTRAAAFERRGETGLGVRPDSVEDLRAALAIANESPTLPLAGLVYVCPLDVPSPRGLDGASLGALVESYAFELVTAVKALTLSAARDYPRLVIVTEGGQALKQRPSVNVGLAPAAGLARTVVLEHPELRCLHVDLGDAGSAREIALLRAWAESESPETQVAFLGDDAGVTAYAPRLVPAYDRIKDEASPRRASTGATSFRLSIDRTGILDRLRLCEQARRSPGRGEVEIETEAASLNFADVMKAMGLVENTGLGGECAGRIVRVGEGVHTWAEGDEVVAVGPDSFASFVTVPESFVFPKPGRLSMAEAACVPVAFLTAHYGLNHLARLAPGERVLIHSATGGVGLAAIQLAMRAGGEIFATAGTEAKRALLRDLGIVHVMDSRSLRFADEVLEVTQGEGVDVVLNSLAGSAARRGLDVLRPFGRFVEIGKRDILSNRSLGLGAFKQNISFFAVNLESSERPLLMQRLLSEVFRAFERRELDALPCRVYPISQAIDAFHEMAHARHVGKLALSTRDPDASVHRAPARELQLVSNATYLVTGGLGALGLEVAAWMVARGARTLVLLGRRHEDEASDAARGVLKTLRAAGAEIDVLSADVGDRAALGAALERIGAERPPLRGVVHAAGILADGLLAEQDRSRFASVFGSKVRGAWNLHDLTVSSPLDFFVLFSSGASLLGSPGQGNYSAANSFLDALAHERQRKGLPALSVNWGPWGEAGLAAREDRAGRLAFRGFGSIGTAEGIAMLEWLMLRSEPQVGVVPMDVRLWRQFYPRAAELPLLSVLLEGSGGAPREAVRESAFRKQLLSLEAGPGRRIALEEHIQEQVALTLRIPRKRLDRSTPLRSLGFDSLMALELRNRLETGLLVRLSATMAWNYPTIAELAPHIATKMGIPLEASSREFTVADDGPATASMEHAAALMSVLEQVKALDEVPRGQEA
jgi:acyl transferase domain-containing protein/NAD(P)-dependent dehydrogenase (short-subunit alcohol dehydrogenase family)/acyl carrier protein